MPWYKWITWRTILCHIHKQLWNDPSANIPEITRRKARGYLQSYSWMTTVQVSPFYFFYKVYCCTYNWRHCNLAKAIPLIFRRILLSTANIPESIWFAFLYVDIDMTILMKANSNTSRWVPTIPRSTLIHPALCLGWLIWMGLIKGLPCSLPSYCAVQWEHQ